MIDERLEKHRILIFEHITEELNTIRNDYLCKIESIQQSWSDRFKALDENINNVIERVERAEATHNANAIRQ